MRDLLTKLNNILLEETTLQDLKKEPLAKDPVIAKAIRDKEQDEGDVKESGLQYYIGKKKYGKDGMKKLAQAGRDGASEQELGKIKDQYKKEGFEIGDDFGISISEDFEIGTTIVDLTEDGIVIELDETAIEYLSQQGFTFEDGELVEEKQKGSHGKACWKGYRRMGTKMKGGKRVDNCVKVGEDSDVEESGLQYYTGKKKYGKEGMAALAAAGRKGASEEELGRIKDRYKKEDIVSEAESYGKMPADAVRTLYNVYKDESQGVRQHHDQEGADRIGKALNDTARELGVSKYMRSLYNSAAGSAHMDFDTNPGDFVNWFTYVGSALETLYKIHKEKGSYDDSPDFEVEKEDFEMEAKYQGREVPLGKPMAGDVKKSKVYVKNAKGNVVKVNFGDKKMKIKKSNPKRRKSFRARHNCATAKDRTTARYWSCRAW